jgi:hypothetical protein
MMRPMEGLLLTVIWEESEMKKLRRFWLLFQCVITEENHKRILSV